VESAVDYANDTLSQTSLDLRAVCPNYVNENVTGVNLNELTELMKEKFEFLEAVGTVNMTQINRTLSTVESALDRVRATIDTTDEKMWVFPLVLLIIFIAGTAMLVGVALAWTGKSNSTFERKMAYGVLPIFIIMTVVCWLLALGSAIASLVAAGKKNYMAFTKQYNYTLVLIIRHMFHSYTDACTDPSATVQAIMRQYNVDVNTTTAQLVTVYTNVSLEICVFVLCE